jgi:hypothetical protein
VGIDGYASNTVEQIGTDSDCSSGNPVYYAWYEFYPHLPVTINLPTIQVGDLISAEVSYDGKQFTVSLSSLGPSGTNGPPFSVSTKLNNARRSSAEWIVEAPGGGKTSLADFGIIPFNNCFATINNVPGSIASFSDYAGITMIGAQNSSLVKAYPSAPPTNAFTVTWANAGP